MINIENYPNLKSDSIIIEFMKSVKETENELVLAKSDYNNAVKSFNKNYKTFPYVIVARMTWHSEKEYFSALKKQ
jgi:LemA protein